MVAVWIFNWQSHSDREITQLTMQPLTMNLIQLIKKVRTLIYLRMRICTWGDNAIISVYDSI